jgi:hypothetical protein
MHPDLLEAYAGALPALEAQERLASITILAAATGHLREPDRRSLVAGLQAEARTLRARPARPRDLADLRRATAGMGVAVVLEERG